MAGDLSFLLLLFAVNGVFAMSEMAMVGARRVRLQQQAAAGDRGAARALELAAEPSRFLSTIQVGITSVGILSGALGEEVIADRLRVVFAQSPALAPYASGLSLAVMVVVVTYLSLIIGELVPKRLALIHPEALASLVARPLHVLATIARPVVRVLSLSTDAVLALFRVRAATGPSLTQEEIQGLIAQGRLEGVLHAAEHRLLDNVLALDDRDAGSAMTPRAEIAYLELRGTSERWQEALARAGHDVLPVCDGGLDQVVGFVRAADVLRQLLAGGTPDLAALASPPLFVPHSVSLLRLLEQFRRSQLPIALVVDEYGNVDGIVSLSDVLAAVVGDLQALGGEDEMIVAREDGSWLVDGMLPLEDLERDVGSTGLVEQAEGHYRTVSGLAMHALGRVPRVADRFERGGLRFEIVDMDGNRVDRVLVARGDAPGPEA
jgi:putative hemolysin